MSTNADALEESIRAVTRLRLTLAARRRQSQVHSSDERSLLKATALAWFQSQRPALTLSEEQLREVDLHFRSLLERSEKHPGRNSLLQDLNHLKIVLIALRSETLTAPAVPAGATVDAPPDFAPLVADPKMKTILEHRWKETHLCMTAGANLAATVMMGGLLEGLLLARLNKMPDLKPAFTAKFAPRDKNGKTLQLKEWTLRDYIEVAHELGWIRRSAKDVGAVLRDYRNYIHPQKELSHGVSIAAEDVKMFWSVFSAIASQIVASA